MTNEIVYASVVSHGRVQRIYASQTLYKSLTKTNQFHSFLTNREWGIGIHETFRVRAIGIHD